jgi:protein Tex
MSVDLKVEFERESFANLLAKSLQCQPKQIAAAMELFDSGCTIPFIARYRKEVTHGLDEIALRAIEDALEKAKDLAARKTSILKSIHEQGLLTDALREQIICCLEMQTLEAMYLPFKPKRKTRATVARERGLQPLAELLLAQKQLGKSRSEVLRPYVDPKKEVPDEASALSGALDIVAEYWSEDLETRQWLLSQAMTYGRFASKLKRGQDEAEAEKFKSYFNHKEMVARIPSHRFLAIQRGEAEGFLKLSLELESEPLVGRMNGHFLSNPRFEFNRELCETVVDCFERLLLPATESSVMQMIKERSDVEAIEVFAKNLRELLLAPPAGPKVTLGVDPGFRTGCKLAVVDATGKFLETATIYPTQPKNDTEGAKQVVKKLIEKHRIELIAIGNGTASRETDQFMNQCVQGYPWTITKVMVSESGASIYSASALAAQEYPDLDVTVRGAISIAHRLQDPLAELVKCDPKSIGVGQYQHDVNQTRLRKSLDREVESCVNNVGVDLNLASTSLLSFVSGIGPKLAEGIVRFRDENGPFKTRRQLLKVPKLGAKAFEQSAGFLRIRDAADPLDSSAVHPESYATVEKMAAKLRSNLQTIIGNEALVRNLNADEFVDATTGLLTVRDIIAELAKPGRDPRSEFKTVQFSDRVQSIDDLEEGMVLEGVITNVTHFGAFVDIGVHQDALVHISQLSNQYVKDPNELVAVGDVVNVRVLEVEVSRKRISLTMRAN